MTAYLSFSIRKLNSKKGKNPRGVTAFSMRFIPWSFVAILPRHFAEEDSTDMRDFNFLGMRCGAVWEGGLNFLKTCWLGLLR